MARSSEVVEYPDYYCDDPVRIPQIKKKKPVRLFAVTAIIAALFLRSTLAANISVGSGKIEFGQGVQVVAACSGSTALTITPYSTFSNVTGAGSFYFSGYKVSNIPTTCYGTTFTFNAYNSDSPTALALFNATSKDSAIYNSSGTYSLINGTGSSVVTNSISSYTVTFTTPVALASTAVKFTLQSSTPVNNYDSILLTNTSYLNMSPGVTLGSGAFTIEFWIKTDSSFDAGSILGDGGANGGMSFILDSATEAHIDGFNVTSYHFFYPAMQTNTWYHVAMARNSSQVETVWINGVRSTTGTLNDTTNYSGASPYVNNAQCTWCVPSSSKFNGERLASLRVVVGTAIYDPTQSTIGVPLMPLATVVNAKLLLNFAGSGALTTDATGTQTVTNNGTTYVSGN